MSLTAALAQAPRAMFISLLIAAAPMILGFVCAAAPSERRLALMRPLSLAAIFSVITMLLLGLLNGLAAIGHSDKTGDALLKFAATAIEEPLLPAFMGFSFLTVAWVCAAVATRRS